MDEQTSIIKSLSVYEDGGDYTELSLLADGTIRLDAEQDGSERAELAWDLDQVRQLIAGLGHLVWLAEHRDED